MFFFTWLLLMFNKIFALLTCIAFAHIDVTFAYALFQWHLLFIARVLSNWLHSFRVILTALFKFTMVIFQLMFQNGWWWFFDVILLIRFREYMLTKYGLFLDKNLILRFIEFKTNLARFICLILAMIQNWLYLYFPTFDYKMFR